MKKIFTILLIAITMAFAATSCHKTVSVNDVINQEYVEVLAQHDSAIFYESHIVLNKKLEDASNVEKLYAVSCENVYQIGDTCYIYKHDLVNETVELEKVNDFWVGSAIAVPTELTLTLTDALKAYNESNITRTTGDKVVLRQPMHYKYDTPLYIFGQQNSPLFVAVNANTGEVAQIE